MEIRKLIEIKQKIFSRENIRDLALFFSKERTSEKDSLKYIFKTTDGTEYTYSELSFLEERSKLDLDKFKQITFDYRSASFDKALSLNMYEDSNYKSDLLIIGNNEEWVNSRKTSFIDLLNSVEKQGGGIFHNIPFSTSVYYLLVFTAYLLSLRTLDSFLNKEPSNAINVISFFCGMLFSMSITYLLNKLFSRIYPNIEFDFGPKHKNVFRKRKTILISILTLILIPIALSFLV